MLWIAVLVTAGAGGCNKDQVDQVQEAVSTGVEQAAHSTRRAVETVKQEANLTGSMELAVNPPIDAPACYVELVALDGRPNVLQLASYKEVELERFPSLLLQAQVEADSLAELAGKTVHGELYAQAEKDGAVWHSEEGAPAAFSVSAVEGNAVTCKITGASLVNSETGERSTVSGKFVGLVE